MNADPGYHGRFDKINLGGNLTRAGSRYTTAFDARPSVNLNQLKSVATGGVGTAMSRANTPNQMRAVANTLGQEASRVRRYANTPPEVDQNQPQR